MTKVCILKTFETMNIFQEKDVAGGSFERYMQFRGNSLLNTVSIDRLDSGSVVFEFYEIIEANVENLIKTSTFTSTGIDQFILIPFHTQIRVKATTTDIASFTLKSTCRDDVLVSQLLQQSQEGTTTTFIGSVTATPTQVPVVVGDVIVGLSIRCAVDQPNNRRLEFSLDGANYARLKVGEAREETPLGGLKQFWVRSAGGGASVNYEIFLNRTS